MCTPFEEAVSVICLREDSVDERVDCVRDWATATVSVVIFFNILQADLVCPRRCSIIKVDVTLEIGV